MGSRLASGGFILLLLIAPVAHGIQETDDGSAEGDPGKAAPPAGESRGKSRDLRFSADLVEGIRTPSTIIRRSVPDEMRESGTVVRALSLQIRGTFLRQAVLRGGDGRILAGAGPFPRKGGRHRVTLLMGPAKSAAEKKASRDLSIEVETFGGGPWSLRLIPLADADGKEIVGTLLGAGHPRVMHLSPEARGFRVRLHDRDEDVTKIHFYVAQREPGEPDPVLRSLEPLSEKFRVHSKRATRFTLETTLPNWDDEVWVDVSFEREVGGRLGASLTVVSEFK